MKKVFLQLALFFKLILFNFLFVTTCLRFLTSFVSINPKLQVSGNTDKADGVANEVVSTIHKEPCLLLSFLYLCLILL